MTYSRTRDLRSIKCDYPRHAMGGNPLSARQDVAMPICPAIEESFQPMLTDKRAEVVSLAERLAIQCRAQTGVSENISELPPGETLDVTLSWSAGMFKCVSVKSSS